MRFRMGLVGLAALVLAGCAAPPPPPVAETPGQACMARLLQREVVFERLADFGEGGCQVQDAVRVSRGGIAWNRAGVLSCATAEAVAAFEAEVVQPLALVLLGQPVAKVHHMGTYNCRGRNGRTGGRLSEHGFGRAIDIRSFELVDGTVVDVQRHWSRAGRKSEFLREVAHQACTRFSVVLSPNHDHLHRDHIHLDTGPYRLCRV